ncbi:alpha/beta hydrolase [Nocardioides phosphati]|uniref:Alpha/beta hydrolase n=1 Tax=Nocardioides phosphati TaxID=1867775 RepID=A0ABQ2N6F1_9ACTN|nr:alpha/beta hydrolase [Nocardioides phosphati]GGO86254.1 alpha/beta hydrolase [Nocardioides phosphati]
MTGHVVVRHDVTFDSDGDSCAAWLFLPQGVERSPVVVLGHGLGASREMRVDAFAERFAAAGIAALAFTHRNFGTSGGALRQVVSIRQQLEDWESALRYVKAHPALDGSRVAVWGSSLGGGNAITVASRHPELAAAVAQCPFTSGVATSLALGPVSSARLLPAVLADLVAQARGGSPVLVPLAGEARAKALMAGPGVLEDCQSLMPAGETFRNEAAARIVPAIALSRPGRAARNVEAPILFCVCEQDTVTPPKPTLRYARRAPRGEVRTYPASHFDIYVGEQFEAAVADQTEFLVRHLDA